MKRLLYITVGLVILFAISCKPRPSMEELLAGKKYKYWLEVVTDTAETRVIRHVSYYDREYTAMGYWYNPIRDTIYIPEFTDVLYDPWWEPIHDMVIKKGGAVYGIRKLSETELILYSPRYDEYYYYIAMPDSLIPENLKRVQEVHEALKPFAKKPNK